MLAGSGGHCSGSLGSRAAGAGIRGRTVPRERKGGRCVRPCPPQAAREARLPSLGGTLVRRRVLPLQDLPPLLVESHAEGSSHEGCTGGKGVAACSGEPGSGALRAGRGRHRWRGPAQRLVARGRAQGRRAGRCGSRAGSASGPPTEQAGRQTDRQAGRQASAAWAAVWGAAGRTPVAVRMKVKGQRVDRHLEMQP